MAKKTGAFMPKGMVFTISCCGGGYGPPSERSKEKMLADLRDR
jgi:N-methylhydantoinase B/oxoprolinase/acetone carboxylase alpha subunit